MSKNESLILGGLALAMASACGGPDGEQAELGALSQALINTNVTLKTFQIPEMIPNTPLETFEEVNGSVANLKRDTDSLRAVLNGKDLPAGAYTFWWHLTYSDGDTIFWAGNDIVGANGNAHIDVTVEEGVFPGAVIFGDGLRVGEAETVPVDLFVRYHGPASSDPEILEDQLTMPWGACADPNNPNPRPATDYPCWNPQQANFGTP